MFWCVKKVCYMYRVCVWAIISCGTYTQTQHHRPTHAASLTHTHTTTKKCVRTPLCKQTHSFTDTQVQRMGSHSMAPLSWCPLSFIASTYQWSLLFHTATSKVKIYARGPGALKHTLVSKRWWCIRTVFHQNVLPGTVGTQNFSNIWDKDMVLKHKWEYICPCLYTGGSF
jgi:hypothetical protein